MHIKASFFLAILIVFPYFVTQLAFYASKRFKAVAKLPRLILAGCILFYSGVAFGYIVITPLATNFLIGYNLPGVVNNPTLQSYLSYIIMFTVPTGVLFQLPLVIYFLAEGGLVTASFLRSHRRHAIVLILAVSAIVTPTVDVVSQLLVAGPLWVLFEISIFIAKRVEKRQLAEENED